MAAESVNRLAVLVILCFAATNSDQLSTFRSTTETLQQQADIKTTTSDVTTRHQSSQPTSTPAPTLTFTTFPHPRVQPVACNRRVKSWLCDPENILKPDQAKTIETTLQYIQHTTDCVCGEVCYNDTTYGGYHVAVVVVRHVPYNDIRNESSPELRGGQEFANYLRAARWTPGQCGDDIVLVLQTDQLKIFTSRGSYIQKKMSSQCVSQTNKIVQPQLDDREYGAAIDSLLQEYILVLQGRHTCTAGSDYLLIMIIGMCIVVIALGVFVFCWIRKRFGICRNITKCKDRSTTMSKRPSQAIYKPAQRTDSFYITEN